MTDSVLYNDIEIGDSACLAKTISEYDVYAYAGISRDFNPIHVNSEYAKGTIFKERIAHGLLSAGLISAVLGTRLPGANSIYISQELIFKAPVKIGDTITAKVEVIEKIDLKKRLILRTTVENQDGTIVIDGKAMIQKSE